MASVSLMSSRHLVSLLLACLFLALCSSVAADSSPKLDVQPVGNGLRLRLSSEPVAQVAGTKFRFDLETSADLASWQPAGSVPSDSDGIVMGHSAASGFFRANLKLENSEAPVEPADQFGFNRVFAHELQQIGQVTKEDFRRRFERSGYLDGIGFDPTKSRFWAEFNTDPAVHNARLKPDSLDRRLHDFRLNAGEMSRFRANGFVVSERLGSYSFADVYYKVYADDLPVFITTDSVLHAWHFSFQKMLEELEETHIAVNYERLLDGMAASLGGLKVLADGGALSDSVRDADGFVAVARSLIKGTPAAPVFVDAAEVARILDRIAKADFDPNFSLWGASRLFDFSQFKVRGHYTRSERLTRYFQAYTWTALADLRLVDLPRSAQSKRELGTALVLHHLYKNSGATASWTAANELLRHFVGRQNSLGLDELGGLLTAAQWTGPDATTQPFLDEFQKRLLEGRIGLPSYTAGPFLGTASGGEAQLPPTFALTGKRFIMDGWAQTRVTFDRIQWNGPGIPERYLFGDKVIRKFPSALDVVFSVFANDGVVPHLAARMAATDGIPGRDGVPYQHNLAATRVTLDQLKRESWDESIYSRWLFALRSLSAPPSDERLPQAMRTRAWAMKDANTQSASWTQLRHDTLLYAAEPYSGIVTCEYPAGFVEPKEDFWPRIASLAQATADTMRRFPIQGSFHNPQTGFVDLGSRNQLRIQFCENFASLMTQLGTLVDKQLAQIPYNYSDVLFIRSAMNQATQPYYGKQFDGWYPSLFYKDYGQPQPAPFGGFQDTNGSDRRDHVVVGVHTAPPDETSPGGVLHEGVGDVDLLLIAVDNGPDKMVYAGPTMSHYEWIEEGPQMKRLTDEEWSRRVFATPKPPRPDWTRGYLVPR